MNKKKLKAGAGGMANATRGRARVFKSKRSKSNKAIRKEHMDDYLDAKNNLDD